MSDLGFDPRPYCERLGACSHRFTLMQKERFWLLADTGVVLDNDDGLGPYNPQIWSTEGARELWRFFGPLADERDIENIRPYDLVMKRCDRDFSTVLEEVIAAVVVSFETPEPKEPRPAWNDGEEGV